MFILFIILVVLLIFSHSVEYLRLFKDNLNVIDDIKVSYWVMSTKEIALIKKEHLFLLRGDYNILNKIILDCKNNNSSLNINNFISLTLIIRELSSVSRKVFDSGNDKLNHVVYTNSLVIEGVYEKFK